MKKITLYAFLIVFLFVNSLFSANVSAVSANLDCEFFYEQLSLIEEISKVPEQVFTNMEAYGVRGDVDFEVTFNSPAAIVSGQIWRAKNQLAASPYTRLFELFATSNLAASPGVGDKVVQCFWDSTKTWTKTIVKPRFFDSSCPTNAVVVLISKKGNITYDGKQCSELHQMYMANLGNDAPSRFFITFLKTTAGSYELESSVAFPGTFSDTVLRNNAVTMRAKTTSAGNAKVAVRISANNDSGSSFNFADGSVVDPDNRVNLPGAPTDAVINPIFMAGTRSKGDYVVGNPYLPPMVSDLDLAGLVLSSDGWLPNQMMTYVGTNGSDTSPALDFVN